MVEYTHSRKVSKSEYAEKTGFPTSSIANDYQLPACRLKSALFVRKRCDSILISGLQRKWRLDAGLGLPKPAVSMDPFRRGRSSLKPPRGRVVEMEYGR